MARSVIVVAASGSASALARIVRVCDAAPDDRTLRQEVIAALRPVLGFEAFAWLLTDPATWVGASPMAHVGWLPELPTHIRLKYLTEVNRWTRLDRPAASLGSAAAGDYPKSLLWREFLGPRGVGDVASAVFVDAFGCWAFLELFRDAEQAPFGSDEIALLTSIAAPVTSALRRLQARSFASDDATFSPLRGPVVLVLAPDLGVRAQTPETDKYLQLLLPPDPQRPPVPAGAYNVAAQLLAVEAGVDANPPTARVHLAHGRWLTLRAARLDGPAARSERDIAVTIEATTPADRIDLFVRVFALTPRESQLLGELASGRDTRELAERLFLSEHTVQDHLKAIFAKTATRSRPTLLARALGT